MALRAPDARIVAERSSPLGLIDVVASPTIPFRHAPGLSLMNLIEPPEQASLPPDLLLLRQRGPFDLAAERRLLREHGIDVVVSKNAGGSATYAKIEAARGLGVPVIMIARPDKPAGDVVRSAEEALAWLAHVRAPDSRRGV